MIINRQAPPRSKAKRNIAGEPSADLQRDILAQTGVAELCGFYRFRYVAGGPWIPIKIALWAPKDEAGDLMQDEALHVFIGDQPPVAWMGWPYWSGLSEITEQEHSYMLRLGRWNVSNDPAAPEHAPRRAVDLRRMKPIT